jgi:uncharacterized protein (TIGR00251 family)
LIAAPAAPDFAVTLSAKPPPAWLGIKTDRLMVALTARPAARRQAVLRVDEVELVVALKSRAHEGRANDELLRLIAKAAGVPASSVRLAHGARGRHKMVEVMTAHPNELASKLRASISSLRT